MTSAFIIDVNSQLQPDPNEETAALLRVLIYKVDNTTFGNDIPSIPRWAGPPHMIVQVQAILLASLATSLFSAFLAMLGKQWLNRYASVDMRGSAIERDQNRQRKLDGIVSWYFDQVMESLPLMLQAALMLLGIALSRYLWEINMTIALVVLGFTASGVLFLFFIVFAGAAYVSCPYQTPGAQILRQVLCQVPGALHLILDAFDCIPPTLVHILYFNHHIPGILRNPLNILRRIQDTIYHIRYTIHHIPDALHPVLSTSIKASICYFLLRQAHHTLKHQWHYFFNGYRPLLLPLLLLLLLLMPVWLITDTCKPIVWLLYILFRQPEQRSEQQKALLDLHCISWTLRTSLDEPVLLSTLSYLGTRKLHVFDPILVVDCSNILFGCIKVVDGEATIAQGMERLATAASMCYLQTLSHLLAIDPTSTIIKDTYRKYDEAFPFSTNIHKFPFSRVLYIIDWASLYYVPGRVQWVWGIEWESYKPPSNEYITVAHALANVTRFGKPGRVAPDDWILHFVLHSLSRSPPSPSSVVIDCLSIVALDLECDPLAIEALGERCVCI